MISDNACDGLDKSVCDGVCNGDDDDIFDNGDLYGGMICVPYDNIVDGLICI